MLPNKLIDGNEINDSQTIAETFNNYFVNTGKTMGSSITPVRREIVHFGFRKNFSTIHGVSHIYENLLENVYHDRYSSCLFLDLSKAFDTDDHEILLHKLERLFGMRGTVLGLMRSYLKSYYRTPRY